MARPEVIIIGAGIAGASLAAELAGDASVLVLEAEAQPGYHATGRSAALFSEIYGSAAIRSLSRASRGALVAPELDVDRPLMTPRGILLVASQSQRDELEPYLSDSSVRAVTHVLDTAGVQALVPIVGAASAAIGLHEYGSFDVDVHALHQAYLRRLRDRRGHVVNNAGVHAIELCGGVWQVMTADGAYEAPVLVNAAGAWADDIARLAGRPTLGLTPKRRTMAVIDFPDGFDSHGWPMVVAADESFYFKPDAGRLLISPADETPSVACDAQPDDYDVALAAHRFELMTGFNVRRIVGRWAGLRTFAPDRVPVVGTHGGVPGFFWLAGQGGYGIQTAPALAKLAAALVRGDNVPGDIAAHGVTAAALSPDRLALRAAA